MTEQATHIPFAAYATQNTAKTHILGLVIIQALIGRFLTAQARVQFQGIAPGICER